MGYTELARWGWHAGALQEAELDQLTAAAEREPEAAAAVFQRAVALRAAVTGCSVPRPCDRPASAISRACGGVREAVAHARLAPTGDGYDWSWKEPDDLGRPLWPVARSAVELLTDGDLRRVKECPGADDCGWLFYDTSRNGARRWCSMEGCGSRVKMRRHYARHRAGSPPAGG